MFPYFSIATLLSFDKPTDMRLRSVEEELEASRLRTVKSFLYYGCSFLCQHDVCSAEARGEPAWKK